MENIEKKIEEIQNLMTQTLNEIGLEYSKYFNSQNESLIKQINKKVENYNKLELKLNEIEKKLKTNSE